ncbi:MAG: ferrous iron transport protein A [Sphingomonadales bacterium]|nr:ferrous iron transport protein A [Sphingomonadales bacterium]
MTLDELKKGRVATVTGIADTDPSMAAKLREVGFAEEDEVEVVHLGPIGGKPICVRLNRTLIALRAEEAAAIEVETMP